MSRNLVWTSSSKAGPFLLTLPEVGREWEVRFIGATPRCDPGWYVTWRLLSGDRWHLCPDPGRRWDDGALNRARGIAEEQARLWLDLTPTPVRKVYVSLPVRAYAVNR